MTELSDADKARAAEVKAKRSRERGRLPYQGGPQVLFKFGKAYKWERDLEGKLVLIKVSEEELELFTRERLGVDNEDSA